MHLEVLTPVSKIFEDDVKMVRFPGTDGSFAVLNNHAPIISTLNEGELKITTPDDKETFLKIGTGIVEVKNNEIIVLVETA